MNTHRSDRLWPFLATITVGGILAFWATYSAYHSLGHSAVGDGSSDSPPYTLASALATGGELHPVHVRAPEAPTVVVGEHSLTGEPITVSCTTCHATRTPDPAHGVSADLDEFHTELTFAHGAGAMSCLACHHAEDYDSLRSADGRRIPYADVMDLCAQCHSKQHTDYLHGAHGGMTGHWDLSRGPRQRNNCTDCHDPHAPAFPKMQPTFKPIDRGLHPLGSGDDH